MPRDVSRERFVKTRAPRLSPKARESKLKVYLSDVILLVLDHYTAAQIGEWLRDYKNVKIGRQAVWRFVKRIQIVLEHLDSCPMSAGDGVLAAMIRDAMIPTDTRRVIATPRAALVAEGGAPKSASTKPNAPEPMNPKKGKRVEAFQVRDCFKERRLTGFSHSRRFQLMPTLKPLPRE
jgi:hypothetical protein